MPRVFRPLPTAIGLTAALGALAIAKTVSPAYQTRSAALRAAATAKRQSLHLNADAACKQDPTPEVRFERALEVHPGQTFHLHIPGVFHGTPGVVFLSDAVQVTQSRLEKDGLTVDGKVSPAALPGEVELSLIRELCPRAEGVSALRVVTQTKWDVAFPNGWKVGLLCGATPAEDGTNCQSTWTGPGGPQAMRATLEPSGEGSYSARYRLNAAQTAQMQKRVAVMQKGPSPEITAQMQKAQASFSECSSMPQAKALACMQERAPALQKAADAYNVAMKQLTGPEGPPILGCERTRFELDGTHVTAAGDACGTAGRLEQGSGTVRVQP